MGKLHNGQCGSSALATDGRLLLGSLMSRSEGMVKAGTMGFVAGAV